MKHHIESPHSRRQFVKRAAMASIGLAIAPSVAFSKTPSVFSAKEFNHISLNVTDIARAMEFFGEVLGMASVNHGGRTPQPGTAGRGGAFMHFEKGFVNLQVNTKPSMNHFCLGIEDFDPAGCQAILQLSGYDTFSMQNGRLLHVYDPDRLNVQIQEIGHGYSGGPGASANIDPNKGIANVVRLHHISIGVTNVKRSQAFYESTFGLSEVSGSKEKNAVYLGLGNGGHIRLGKAERAGMDHVCFAVRKFDEKRIRVGLKKAGFALVETKEENVVAFRDAEGLLLQLIAAE